MSTITFDTEANVIQMVFDDGEMIPSTIEITNTATILIFMVAEQGPSGPGGTVTSVSVATANGFSASIVDPTGAAIITLQTTVTGLLKGNGTAIQAAVADTDYLLPATASSTYLSLAAATSTIRAALSSGIGISYNSTSGVITNSAPDQIVTLTQGANITITGTYPNFTIASTSGSGGVTTLNGLNGAVTLSAGSNITLTPIGNDIEISASGSGGTGTANVILVNQASHGFIGDETVYFNGSLYVLGLATTEDSAEIVGFVTTIVDSDNFMLTLGGKITFSNTTLTPGLSNVYFQSDTVPGGITLIRPTTTGYIVKPLIIPISSTEGIFDNMRGEIIGGVPTAYPYWDAGTSYSTSDIVQWQGNAFRATNSSLNIQPDIDYFTNGVANWELIIDRTFPEINIYKDYIYNSTTGSPQLIGNGISPSGNFYPKILLNTLRNNGDKIEFKLSGTFPTFNASRNLGVYFGPDNTLNNILGYQVYNNDPLNTGLVFNSGILGNFAYWTITGYIELTDINSQEIRVSSLAMTAGTQTKGDIILSYNSLITIDSLFQDLYLYIFGSSGDNTDGDIVFSSGYIKFTQVQV